MDGFKGKRPSKKASASIDLKKKDVHIPPLCTRLGCSSRINDSTAPSFSSPAAKKSSKVTSKRQQMSSSLLLTETSSVHDEIDRGKTKESAVVVGCSSKFSTRGIPQRPDLVTRDARVNRHGLKDCTIKLGADVIPFNSNLPRRKSNVCRKKNGDGESSSSSNRGNKTAVVESINQSSSSQGNGITIPESRRNGVVSSSTTRRPFGYFGRPGRSGVVATLQAPRPTTRAPHLNPSRSAEVSRSPSNSYSSNGSLRSRMMLGSPSEISLSHSLMNRDGFRHYNMNGVAEVLLALERIEQDEELTYEQLVVLETNLFLNGLTSFHDQHRDMRLDIDHMSYEELLALEEKMGTVSTALSEEALLKSLKSSIYRPTNESCLNKVDDVKCSICQEEYIDRDEIGTLGCNHMYHVSCAQQWLRMKNWCPICKSSAESQPQPFS